MDADEAKRRLISQDSQALRDLKQRHWDETTLPASVVFTKRLREMRKARGLNQAQLAHRMTAKGYAISETALGRIESRKRGLSLDEAFALIEALDAVPVYMLTPPDDKLIRLSESVATDGEGLRSWFVSGVDDLPPRLQQPPPAEIADAVERDERARTNIERMARLAQALLDAYRDAPEGEPDERTRQAWTALRIESKRQEHERGQVP